MLLSALALNCQREKPEILENLLFPKIEVKISGSKPLEKLEEKVQPKRQQCTIDLSDHFIPEILSLSRDAEQYFTAEGILQDPRQRERFGIFSSFGHHQKPFEHYAEAIGRRGDQKQPKIELKFVPYTTQKTIRKISSLEQQLQDGQLSKNQKCSLPKSWRFYGSKYKPSKMPSRSWLGRIFIRGEVSGIYDQKTALAIIKYQQYHQQQLRYNWNIDGRINLFTRELLNKNFDEYAFAGVRKVLEERVFHAKCEVRYPLVIEPPELEKLVDDAAAQLQLNTIDGVQRFFLLPERESETVYLEIPERYQQDFMQLEIDVEKWDSGKWEKVRTKTKLRLYAIEDGKKVELFQTKAVVGGWGKMRGIKKFFKTPGRRILSKEFDCHAPLEPAALVERKIRRTGYFTRTVQCLWHDGGSIALY